MRGLADGLSRATETSDVELTVCSHVNPNTDVRCLDAINAHRDQGLP